MGAANEFTWPKGAKAAVSLAFDGGLPEHVELVAPALDEHGLKGTFFVTVPNLLENPAKWKRLAENGHEIASHSLKGVTENGKLTAWTFDMLRDDLRMTEKGIAEICEAPVTSFALPGEETECNEGDYKPILTHLYTAIRSPLSHPNPGVETDLLNVGSLFWEDLVGQIESYLPEHGHWNVIVFERFFGLDVQAAEDDLRFLIAHLVKHEEIWTAPVNAVSEWISHARAGTPSKT